jgi:hypothetical protein
MKLPVLKEIIEERKEKAVGKLLESYAKNRLPLEEYERLVEYIHKIESERELVVVEKIVAEYGESAHSEAPVYDDEDEPDHYSSKQRPQNSKLAILSSRLYSGPLQRSSEYISILGSNRIEIRKADLSRQRTDLNVVVILGDCVIYVESGIRVINKAVPVLGSAGISQKVIKQAREDAPEINIAGVALLGDVSVKLLRE